MDRGEKNEEMPGFCSPASDTEHTLGAASECDESVKLEGKVLSATNLRFLPFPAAFSLGRPPLPQPFCAAKALDGRKGLLEVLEGGQVLPSYALVAVVAGLG